MQPAERLPTLGPAPAFSLTRETGGRFRSRDTGGKVAVVTFIYTSCGDVCPLLTQKLVGVQDALGQAFGRDVVFVSITLDPEVDRPEVLARYGREHGLRSGRLGLPHRIGRPRSPRSPTPTAWCSRSGPTARSVHNLLTSISDRRGVLRVQYMGMAFDPDEFEHDVRDSDGRGRAAVTDWLPQLVGRLPVTVRTKLLAAFFSIVAMFMVLGAVGLGVLHGADRRADELINLQRQIAAYQQLQSNTTDLLYTVTSAFLATDDRGRWRPRCAGSASSATTSIAPSSSAATAQALIEPIKADYAELIRLGTEIVSAVASGSPSDARVLAAARRGAARRPDRAQHRRADQQRRIRHAGRRRRRQPGVLRLADGAGRRRTRQRRAGAGVSAMRSPRRWWCRCSGWTSGSRRWPPATSPAGSRSSTATSWATWRPTSTG